MALELLVDAALKGCVDATFQDLLTTRSVVKDPNKLGAYIWNYVHHKGEIVTAEDLKDEFRDSVKHFFNTSAKETKEKIEAQKGYNIGCGIFVLGGIGGIGAFVFAPPMYSAFGIVGAGLTALFGIKMVQSHMKLSDAIDTSKKKFDSFYDSLPTDVFEKMFNEVLEQYKPQLKDAKYL